MSATFGICGFEVCNIRAWPSRACLNVPPVQLTMIPSIEELCRAPRIESGSASLEITSNPGAAEPRPEADFRSVSNRPGLATQEVVVARAIRAEARSICRRPPARQNSCCVARSGRAFKLRHGKKTFMYLTGLYSANGVPGVTCSN